MLSINEHMEAELFQQKDYKTYLNARLDQEGRGSRARFALLLSCQTSYIAQVLRGKGHFNMDQAEGCNQFFNHSEDEAQYFLALVAIEKAGSAALRERYQQQLQSIKKKRLSLKERLEVMQPLQLEAQAKYYSSWIYSAIHALASLPQMKSANAIASRLKITATQAEEAIQFLLKTGLLKMAKGKLEIGTHSIHLDADSPLVSRHHINWRLRAVESLDRSLASDLHYSSVVSLSEKDAELIREQWVKAIQNSKKIIRNSPEEVLRVFSMDFFSI